MTTARHLGELEGYEAFFGLKEAPFSLAPDPRFLFTSASHSAALAQIAYALQRREPLVVVTGDIGTGKTLLCRTVLQRLHRKTFLSVIIDPLLGRDDLLKQLLQDFGVISKDRTKLTETSRYELVQTLHAFLSSLAAIDAHAVVIIDEAQHLQPEVLEQIRLLSNSDDAHGTLLQIILVGQTDLDSLLARPELRQLQQRVSRRFLLQPLKTDEVEQYIEHRLGLARVAQPSSQTPGATELAQELAEWSGTKPAVAFAPDAIEAVSEYSGGVPRVINLLCDRSLEAAHASGMRTIDRRLVDVASRALGVTHEPPAAPVNPDINAQPARDEVDASVWAVTPSELRLTDTTVADDERGGLFGATRGPATTHLTRYLLLAAAFVVVGLAILVGVRTTGRPAASSAPPESGARPGPSSAPQRAPGAETPAPRPPDTPTSSTAAATGSFDVVVASFRTEARATSVAAEVAALGLPILRRVADGWQQVISGPFASRTAAEEAQQRLLGAGLIGSQIVPTPR